MSECDLISSTAHELSQSLIEGKTSSEEIIRAFLSRIEQVDDRVHAYLHWDGEEMIAQAKGSDERRAHKENPGPPRRDSGWPQGCNMRGRATSNCGE